MISISEINGISKQGVRDNNEDYIKFNVDNNRTNLSRVIVLCDGMGGHAHGEIASQIVAECVFSTLNGNKTDFSENDLQQALDNALIALNKENVYDDSKKMGTTLVVAVVNRKDVLVGHVGDSRCYLFNDDGIVKFRTKDHSKVAEAVEAEILTEEEAINSEHKNILTRCVVAGETDVKIEVDRLNIKDKDRLLLCSDGVIDAIRDEELSEILVNRDITDALALIDSKCQMKSHDNYSVIIADLENDHADEHSESVSSEETTMPPKIDEASFEFHEWNYRRKINEMYEKINCLNQKHKKTIRIWSVFWSAVGFISALLLCGAFSYSIVKQQKKAYEKEIIVFQNSEIRTSKMITTICKQENNKDSLFKKQELLRRYNDIQQQKEKEEKEEK